MRKLFEGAVVALTLVLALACGGTDESSSGAFSIAGAIDSSSVPGDQLDGVLVGAFQNGSLVSKATPEAGANDEDHTYLITGLDAGSYTVKVYRTIDSFPPGNETVELLSSEVVADADSGDLETRNKTIFYKRQINVFTTYIVQKAAATGVDVDDVLDDLGVVADNLDDFEMADGQVTLAGAVADLPTEADDAVKFMTIAVVAAVQMELDDLANQADTLTESFTAIATTEDFQSSTAAALVAIADLVTAVSDVLNNFDDLLSEASDTVAALVEGGIENLTDAESLADTVTAVNDSLDSAIDVTSFGLAHDTAYGVQGTKDFTLNSLAPVFKVTFAGNSMTADAAKDLLSLSLTKGSTTISLTTATSGSNTLVDILPSTGSSETFYLLVKKGYGDDEMEQDLTPGSTYSYTASSTGVGGNVKFGSALSQSGTITTRKVTFTYPYTGSQNAIIDLGIDGHMGLASDSDHDFMIDVAGTALKIDASESGYGIFGTDSALDLSVSEDGTVIGDDSNAIGNVDVETSSSTAMSSGTLTLRNGLTSAGSSYTITLSDDEGLMDSSDADVSDYPKNLAVDISE